MTAAKVRLAMAAMGQKETNVTDLCSKLAITRQTLYRHLAPDGDAFSGAQDQLDNGSDRFVNQVYYGNLQDRVYNLLLLNRENAYVAGKLTGTDAISMCRYTFLQTGKAAGPTW